MVVEKTYLAEKGTQLEIKQGVEEIAEQISKKEVGKVMKSKVFNSPGSFTWQVPAGVTEVYLTGCGGGGSGATGQSTSYGGGSGGGAMYVEYHPITVVPLQTYTITVGSGGVAPTSVDKNGQSGGMTSFGSLISLPGGGGGIAGGLGGAAGGPFGVGGTKAPMNSTVFVGTAKGGDCGPYRGGNVGSTNNAEPGGDGGPGAGGGGAGTNNATAGSGGNGFLFIKWWE